MSVANDPAVKAALAIVRNRRTDAMFVVACLFVVWLVYLVVYATKIGEFAQGVVTTVLGVFLNELKNMYSYETGTTRGEMNKATTIENIAKSVPVAAAAAALAATATNANVQPWVTGRQYTNEQIVSPNGSGIAYVCIVPHTSGVFKDDLAAGKWALKNP